MDEALEKLERNDGVKAQLVKRRFYAGLTIAEAAKSLGISLTTAKSHWAYGGIRCKCSLKIELELANFSAYTPETTFKSLSTARITVFEYCKGGSLE